jgi:penicillin amidase
MGARPPEFVLLGLQPEPWDPVDSLAWAVMMAWDLGGNWTTEMQRLRLSAKLPVARIDELLPPYRGERAPVVRDYAALYRELGLNAGRGAPGVAATPGDRAALGRGGRGLEQLGAGGQPHHHGQAAAGQ